VNARAKGGYKALRFAAKYNSSPESMEALLKAGADPKIKDEKGKLPADYSFSF